MNILFLQNWTSIAEAMNISAIHTRIISYVNGKLLVSQIQDSVIGGYLLTRDEVKMDLVNVIRLHSNSQVSIDIKRFKFEDGYVSGKQALSYILPQISYTGNSAFVTQGLDKYIEYKPTDKQLKIELGEIKTGYFDYGANDFQKQIALYYDQETTLNIIFSIQQAILNQNKYFGFTVGFKDLLLGKKSQLLMQQKKDKMLVEGKKIIQQYTKNALMNPIEQNKWSYFMGRITEIFFDDGVEPIMYSAGFGDDYQIIGNKVRNNLINLALTKSKGSLTNLKNMIFQIGQALIDGEPLKLQFQGRLNMFFKKNDQDPLSYGIIMDSYHSGLTPQSMLTNAIPERTQMLQKVLSVAKPGNQGRKMRKNLEPLIINNVNCVEKNGQVTQFLFGHDGFQIQNLSKYKIPNVFSSYKTIHDNFHSTLDNKIYTQLSKQDQLIVNNHTKYVADLIQTYKEFMIRNQLINNAFQLSDTIQIPIVINVVIQTVISQVQQSSNNKMNKGDNFKTICDTLTTNIHQINEFIDNLKYLYFNDNLQNKKTHIPQIYDLGVNPLKLAILTCFTYDKICILNKEQLSILLSDIRLSIQYSLVDPGTPIGVNVAQAYQEFFTQDLLDAIHKTATGKQQRNPLDRIIEIFNNKSPVQLQQSDKQLPIIRIPLIHKNPEIIPYDKQKERAEYIASNIKLIQVKNLCESWEMLLQSIERNNEHTYIMDKNFLSPIPDNYTQWCLRIVFDKMKLYLNKISISEIKIALETRFNVFILTSKENQQKHTMRLYLGNEFTFTTRHALQTIVNELLDFNVRGISNILSANVIVEKLNILDKDNQIIQIQKHVIISEGYNLKDIYRLQHIYMNDIDFNNITSDNHYQIMQLYGIGACQQKLVNEIRQLFGTSLDLRHVQFVANEMIQQGKLSTLEADGITVRCPNNQLLAISESRAINGLTKGALQNKRSIVDALSSNTIMGQSAKFGCEYNSFVVNDKFFSQNQSSYKDLLSDI